MHILFVEDHQESADACAAFDQFGLRSGGRIRWRDRDWVDRCTCISMSYSSISLPDADGRDLCRQVRGSGASQHACIFAVAGMTDLSDDELSPFDGYLVKPLTVDALQSALKTAEG